MIKIERETFGENERVIHKGLIRLGYKKIDNQYVLKDNVTKKGLSKEKKDNKSVITKVNNEKLTLLLENFDELLLLINKNNIISNITRLRSNVNYVRSFRIDTGIYEEIKKLSYKSNESIGEIINIALEQYLKNL